MRIPNHIGIIPDGNRRWALKNGLLKEDGYEKGLLPGLEVLRLCKQYGIKEVTYYGFTVDNTKRPMVQRIAFTAACINAVKILAKENASLLIVGNYESAMFPKELLKYKKRTIVGKDEIKVNFLVNYGYDWDLKGIKQNGTINSHEISRMDLVIRWGGHTRLSGFLPVQSVYSDLYVIDDYWPDFKPEQFDDALSWYSKQDVTLGG